jgi:hypothetical protein
MLYECMQKVGVELSAKNLIIFVSLLLCVCVGTEKNYKPKFVFL